MALLITGKISIILSSLGYYGVNFPPAYRYNLFLIVGIFSIFFFILYMIYEICEITIEKIKKRENIKLENLIKYLLSSYIFFIAIPQSRKYGLRLMGYVIFPYVIYYIIKNRKKIKYEISDIFLGGFWLSIFISMKNSLDRKNVLDEFQDGAFIFLIPLIMKQLNFGIVFEKLMIRFGMLAFSIKILLGYLEKVNVVYGVNNFRVGGGDEIWRYAGVIMLGIVPLIYILIEKNRFKTQEKIYVSYGLFLSLFPMVWTQNRANWVAIMFVVGLMVISKNLKKGIIVVLTSTSLLLGAIYSEQVNNVYINRVESVIEFEEDRSIQGRFEIWKESLEIFKQEPVIGVGYSYQSFTEREDYFKYLKHKHPYGHSHNSYLYILATMGILGFVFFMGFNISLLYNLFESKNFISHLALYLLISWQIMGFFETPIKYLDMMGVILYIIGYAQNKNIEEKKDVKI